MSDETPPVLDKVKAGSGASALAGAIAGVVVSYLGSGGEMLAEPISTLINAAMFGLFTGAASFVGGWAKVEKSVNLTKR